MFFGLRRSEADCLTWEQVLTQEKKIRIETTPYFSPKSENSEREIPIQESVLRDLVRWKEEGHPVFVLDGGEAKPNCPYTYYRAAETWDNLIEWLRKNGVNKRTPIHYLRGLAGSLMYETNDVYAAQRYLGHSDIRTTIGSYLHEGAKTFEIVPEKPTS
jgi:integrase